MKPQKIRREWKWKCQNCGQIILRITKGEPRGSCPICKDRGVKSFVESPPGKEGEA